MGAELPKKPAFWGDDFNGVEINRDPSGKAPVTVTDPLSLTQPVQPLPGRTDRKNGWLAPEDYARLGEEAARRSANPLDPTGEFQAAGTMFNLGQMLQFHRGGALDAGAHGGTSADGNYAFGIYNAARGAKLPDVLDLANLYGKIFSSYPDPKANPKYKRDAVYGDILEENVQNITRRYNDYHNGGFRRNR